MEGWNLVNSKINNEPAALIIGFEVNTPVPAILRRKHQKHQGGINMI